jgi:hypothetical protein
LRESKTVKNSCECSEEERIIYVDLSGGVSIAKEKLKCSRMHFPKFVNDDPCGFKKSFLYKYAHL